jgi:septin family protein
VHKSSQDEAAVDQDEDFEDEVQDLNSRQHSMVEILGDEVRLARARINVPQPEIKISQKYIEEPVNYSAGNDRVRVRLQIITCPKFGSFANNLNAWAPIIKYIEDQHLLYMLQEEQPSRTQLVDNRVHACVYFISPNSNGLKPLDAHVMKLLHTKVNLIPVIAKADSYSRDELTTTKKRVNDALKQEKIHVFRPPGYNDVHDDNRHYPFAIITEETPGSGGRCYAPGLASVSDLNHCDFVRLKRLLIEQHMVDLIEETDSRYLPFRKELMYKRIEAARMDNNGYPQTHLSFDGGLETFRHISKAEYGHDFLREQQLQTDLVYNTYVDGLKEAVRRTVNYYDKRFRDWRRELAEKQDEMEDELVRLNKG